MSTTLPTSTTTRRKRKKSRLLDAISNGNVDKIVKLLANCDPNFIDESTGETPLSLSASLTTHSSSTSQRVIVALVNGGALLDFRTKDGRTALHCAVQKSNYTALKTFLDLGASPNYRDTHSLTPLFYSILNKTNPKLTQLLLHEHSVHGIVDHNGWQEVHHACKLGLVTHLEQLLYYGCDMNCKIVGSGNTPLHVAAINEQMECARVLLLRGCNTTIVNNSHQNAYQVAVIAGNMNLAELIANHKAENVVPYRDKPKYNPARRPPSTTTSTTTQADPAKTQQQRIKEEFTAKYLNGRAPLTPSSCCPPSSPLSQRSCANSANINTSSSGVSCEVDGSHSEEAGEDEVESEDESTSRKSQNSRRDGRKEVRGMGIGSSTTLPARGRKPQPLMTSSVGPVTIPQNRYEEQKETRPITSYDEKTVSLHRGAKGFGFVLRGAKATSPVLKQESPNQLQPISLQYLDEIEADGIAEAAGLRKGDFLLNVNGVDVRSAPHEQVVTLIRQSGDKVTMTVATPIYQELDSENERKTETTPHDEPKSNGEVQNGEQRFSTVPRGPAIPLDKKERISSKSRAPPPAPPRRDPSTTLTIGRARARSLCISTTTESSDTSSSHHLTTKQVNQNGTQNKSANENCDSEGRSTKSSSPSTSIESMVVNTHKPRSTRESNSKIASIRARGSRRMSAFELEEFFARQSDDGVAIKRNYENNKSTTLQAIKKKKKKKLQKNYHSTPDIQQELLLQAQQEEQNAAEAKKLNRLSSSQEDLRGLIIPKIQSETLTLKNGKIVKSEEVPVRVPPPTHPPPPPPTEPKPNLLSVVVKVDVRDKHSKSDYANFAQLQEGTALKTQPATQPLSSFRPPQPLPETNSAETTPKVAHQVEKAKQLPLEEAASLRKLQGGRSKTTSVYSRQDTLELMDDDDTILHQPFIPEPDYSSTDDDADTPTNVNVSDLSTFKSVTTSEESTKKMTQSYTDGKSVEKTNGSPRMVNSAIESRKPELEEQEEKLKNSPIQTNSSATSSLSTFSSFATTNGSEGAKITNLAIYDQKKEDNDSEFNSFTDDKTPSEPINKVKKSIQIFERRSSLTGETGTPATGTSVKPAKKASEGSINREQTSSSTGVSNSSNNIRVSKSCFEVDCCDNSSSGVSSDVDGDGSHQPCSLGSHANETGPISLPLSSKQEIQTLNRRNSAIVSEKIAHLMAQQTQHPLKVQDSLESDRSKPPKQTPLQPDVHQQLQQQQQQQQRRSAMSCPPEPVRTMQHNAAQHNAAAGINSGSVPVKAAPTMAKTWSEISSAIRAVKGDPVMRTASAARQQSTKSGSNKKPELNGQSATSSTTDSDNIIELVPPPPEFAAPPPHGNQKGHPNQAMAARSNQAVHSHHKQSSPQLKKEEIRILTPQPHQLQHHIIHKPTPQQLSQVSMSQTHHHQRSSSECRKPKSGTLTAVDFSDASAASRLGVQQQQHFAVQQLQHSQHSQYHHGYLQQQQQQQHYHYHHQHPQFATLTRYSKQVPVAKGQSQQYSAGHFLTLARTTSAMDHPSQTTQHYLVQTTQHHQNHPNYHQVATLTRNSRAGAHTPINVAQANSLYSDYTRLTVQNRLLRQQGQAAIPTQAVAQPQVQHTCQQAHQMQPQQIQQAIAGQHYSHGQQLQVVQTPPQPSQPPPPGPPPSLQKQPLLNFQRKSIVDWVPEDVCDWLMTIGMGEHRGKFEFINGVKLLRVDNNDLMGIGVRQGQHRCYILEKIKQQLHFQQQHPPTSQ